MAGPPPGGGCARSGAAMSPEPTAPERAMPFRRPGRGRSRPPPHGHAETDVMTGVSLVDVLLAAVAGSARHRHDSLMAAPTRSTAAPWREGSTSLMALIDARIPEAS